MGRGRQPALDGREGTENQKSKAEKEEQFHGERPVHSQSRILVDWREPDGRKEGPFFGGQGRGLGDLVQLIPSLATRASAST